MKTITTNDVRPRALWRTVAATVLLLAMIVGMAPTAVAQTYVAPRDYVFNTINADPPIGTVLFNMNLRNGPQDVPYYINNAVIAAGYEPSVRNAFATMQNDPGSNISFIYMGATSATSEVAPVDGINVVSFGTVAFTIPPTTGTAYLNGAWATDSFGNFVGSDYQFDIRLSNLVNWSANPFSGQYDLESVTLHELGHALGLGHPTGNTAPVMYDVLYDGERKRALHPADRLALAALYPQFNDVSSNAYYTDAVEWASARQITTGTSVGTFSPNSGVSRAQMATFLWRYAGEPDGAAHPFTDVPAGQYYTDAVRWLAQSGITTGTTTTTFSPNDPVTRAQMATFLWRMSGQPAAGSSGFSDVPNGQYFSTAVGWMVANQITTGTTTTTFSPNQNLSRGQAVTFLWRLAGTP